LLSWGGDRFMLLLLAGNPAGVMPSCNQKNGLNQGEQSVIIGRESRFWWLL
jgi:hypothetical protein